MADFHFDIGDKITDENGAEFEVVSRSENTLDGELQYTVVSKAHADVRREALKAQEEADRLEAETQAAINTPAPENPAEVAAPAAASEPETLQPR